ncbi:hypothetical protein CU254_17235 [Amycolatopsis sp. AA4]|uniref:hypothetical protein n=1 Tax=Actinomycetes TaxID=1760 RepID=UPI0001B54001|nr:MULTISPECIES: hypothetical protein [Actinomycetes]ATY12013.1 hypothetical protein CU254_17235 [Amycolatopsis sp. AA4]
MHADDSGAATAQGPALADCLARFPCPLLAPQESVGLGPAVSWNVQGVDSLVTALELVYESDNRCQLMVKTVRSREGLDPRGLPIDTVADLLSNYLSRADVLARPDRYRSTPGNLDRAAPTDPAAHRERYRRIQHAADQATAATATVACDDAPVAGQRTDALGAGVLELPWRDGATVWCVGMPDILDRLVLRTATSQDLSRF